MPTSNDFAIARFASLSDEELRRVVTLEREDWQPYALALAEEELTRRETMASPYRKPVVPASENGLAAPVGGPLKATWVDVWSALLLMGAIGNVVSAVITDGHRQAIGRAIFAGLFAGAVAIGLRRRSTLAWWLNWFLIASPLMMGLRDMDGFTLLGGLALSVPNGYYFVKHRTLFGMPQ